MDLKRSRDGVDEDLRPKRMAPVIQGLSANTLVAMRAQIHKYAIFYLDVYIDRHFQIS